MSGRKINDRSFWAGGRSKASPFPEGAKSKSISQIEGAGHVGSNYPDTEEQIGSVQRNVVSKTKGHPLKPGYRY